MKRKLKISRLEERIVLDAAATAIVVEASSDSTDCGDAGSNPDLPNVIYVDASNDNATQDGSSWDNAYSSLQDALEAAEASAGADQIWIAEGRYTPSEIYSPDGVVGGASGLNTDNLKTFNLPDQVELLGGFSDGMEYLHQRNPDKHVVVLDGDLLGNDINDKNDPGYLASKADNSWHVLMATNDVAGTGVNVKIDGLTVMNGYAAGPATPALTNNEGLRYTHDYGGGMVINWDSVVHVNNVTWMYNHANGDGGAMFYNNSDVVVSDSDFLYNDSGLRGGAIEAFATEDINTQPHEMLITSSRFIGNTAFVFGGAIVAEGSAADDASHMTIEHSYFEANHALEGGAIVVDSLNTDINSSHFYRNTADVNAGAIGTTNIVQQLVWADNRFFTTKIADSVFIKNSARADAATAAFMNSLFSAPPFLINFGTGGGAIVNYMRGQMEVDRSLFIGNSTEFGEGGAILSGDSASLIDPDFYLEASVDTIIRDSAFIGNRAVDGGAVAAANLAGLQPANGYLRNNIDISGSVFAANQASNNGGALYLENAVANVNENRFWFFSEAGGSGEQIYASNSEVNGYHSSNSAAESDVILNNRFHLLDVDEDLEFI